MCLRVGIGREFQGRVDQRVLRWFGHVERIAIIIILIIINLIIII